MIDDLIGITTDFQSWYNDKEEKFFKNTTLDKYMVDPVRTDWQGLRWLNQHIEFEGFMTGPVGAFYGLPVEARAKVLTNPTEFVEYCNNTKNQIFLYDLLFLANSPQYFAVNENFEPIILESPTITTTGGEWRVRYGELVVTEETK